MKVSKFIAALTSVTVLGATASSSMAAVNRLVNGGFESPQIAAGGEVGGAGDGWQYYNNVFTDNTVGGAANRPPAQEGTQVLKTYGGGSGAYQDVAVTPGQTFTASAAAIIISTDQPTSYIGGQLLAIYRDAANANNVGNALAAQLVTDASTRDQYFTGTVTGTVPAGVGFIRIQANEYSGGGGAVFFDNFVLNTAAAPEPTTLAAFGLAGVGLIRRRRHA